jgi:hypothetical protein
MKTSKFINENDRQLHQLNGTDPLKLSHFFGLASIHKLSTAIKNCGENYYWKLSAMPWERCNNLKKTGIFFFQLSWFKPSSDGCFKGDAL